ncbi:hypothetical protein GCM10025856_26330 [Methylophaga marina]|uniref:Lipoyl-binding domain-containing protein n=1 Tax=Methylophaga marina TaxID=45495 RepID=A0ABP3DPA2_9GAMM|nr:glycine cleavage system protein H [Methylophaga marina]BDZ74914.1 hypothetical protein GCM10025856_26330 [Methylophaga marina]
MADASDNHQLKRFYTSQHIWIDNTLDPDEITLGITEFYQDLLGDITHIQMPTTNKTYNEAERLFVIESLKSATEFLSPFTGMVTKLNLSLNETPNLINHDPFGNGWICQLRIDKQVKLEQQFMTYMDYELMLDG